MGNTSRLVIAEVDGTLVTKIKELTPRAIEAVKHLRGPGIAFAITSGRPPLGMQMFINPHSLSEPLAAFNGGLVVRPDMSVMSQSFVPPAIVSKVVEAIVRHGLDVWVYTDRDWLVREVNAPHVAREQWTVMFAPKIISDDYAAIARSEADVQHDYGNHVSAARSQPYLVMEKRS